MNARMRKLALFAANLLLFLFLLPAQPSYAGSVGSAPCVSTVTTTSTTSVVYSGGKCYIIFKGGSNAWTAPSGVTSVSLLIIGGGGAGGSGAWGGGGGAGGIVWDTSYPVTALTQYSLVVGDSGTPGTNSLTATANRGTNGGDSWFYSNSSMVAKGGGVGSSYAYDDVSTGFPYCDGGAGGSGGGSTECVHAGNTNDGGASNQSLPSGADLIFGNSGGSTASNTYQSGGGGGGAGAPGTAVTASQSAGAGGSGTQYFKPLLAAIASAMPTAWQETTTAGYIAGGGGGAASLGAAGGLGGGGAGGNNSVNSSNGTSGVPNTGSGGGGASCCSPIGYGGYGATGLIVIQYSVTQATSISLGVAGNATTAVYRSPISITATTVGNNANVKFYQNGKVIPGCQSIPSSGFQATCSFRPAQKGLITIKAVLAASSGYLSSTSLPITLSITPRSGKR